MLNFLFKKWISLMIETENNYYNLKEKYVYLKNNNIRCRIKNLGGAESSGMSMSMGMGSIAQNVSLDVHYKDVEKATQLLKK